MSGLLQAAAAVAAAAETFIGYHLTVAGSRQGSGRLEGGVGVAGEEGAHAEGDPVFGGSALRGGAEAARKLPGSLTAAVDSFSCPPVFPIGGRSATDAAGAGSASAGGGPAGVQQIAQAVVDRLPKSAGGAPFGAMQGQLVGQQQAAPEAAACHAVVAAEQRVGELLEGGLMEGAAGLKRGGGPAFKVNPFAGGAGGLGVGGGPFGGLGPFGVASGVRSGAGELEDEEVTSARISTRVDADRASHFFDAAAVGPCGKGGAEAAAAAAVGGEERGAAAVQQQQQQQKRTVFSGVSIHEITPAADSENEGEGAAARAAARQTRAAAELSERERREARRQWLQQRAARARSGGGEEDEGAVELPPPPSYAESVGGTTDADASEAGLEADDERDASNDGAAASEQLPLVGAEAGGKLALVRGGAALEGGGGGPATGDGVHGGEAAGLVRRAGSGRLRAGSLGQHGAAGMDGVMLVGMPTYGYGDYEDTAPLVGGMYSCTAGQVRRGGLRWGRGVLECEGVTW